MKRLQAQKCAANMKRRQSRHEALAAAFLPQRSHEAKRTVAFRVPKARFIAQSAASFFMHRRCASLKKEHCSRNALFPGSPCWVSEDKTVRWIVLSNGVKQSLEFMSRTCRGDINS